MVQSIGDTDKFILGIEFNNEISQSIFIIDLKTEIPKHIYTKTIVSSHGKMTMCSRKDNRSFFVGSDNQEQHFFQTNKCEHSCHRCDFENSKICLDKICTKGQFLDSEHDCQDCHQNCLECSKTPTLCLLCRDNWFLEENNCKESSFLGNITKLEKKHEEVYILNFHFISEQLSDDIGALTNLKYSEETSIFLESANTTEKLTILRHDFMFNQRINFEIRIPYEYQTAHWNRMALNITSIRNNKGKMWKILNNPLTLNISLNQSKSIEFGMEQGTFINSLTEIFGYIVQTSSFFWMFMGSTDLAWPLIRSFINIKFIEKFAYVNVNYPTSIDTFFGTVNNHSGDLNTDSIYINDHSKGKTLSSGKLTQFIPRINTQH